MVIELKGVHKSFNEVSALSNVELSVPEGSITVLLGPNGAGKTTAIRVITGALNIDKGNVKVFGENPTSAAGESIRSNCGVVSAKPSLYDRLNGRDNLLYAAELYGLPKGLATTNRVNDAANQFGILESLEHQVGGYSTGMKTRLALARAILHKPDLLLLDEPTSGLDPVSAASVLEMIGEMTSNGQTVLMCTHLLLEAEGLADRIVVMEHGETIIQGDPKVLSTSFWPNPRVEITAQLGEDLDCLADYTGVVSYIRNDRTAKLELVNSSVISDIILELSKHNVRLDSVKPIEASLEELYFAIQDEQKNLSKVSDPNDSSDDLNELVGI